MNFSAISFSKEGCLVVIMSALVVPPRSGVRTGLLITSISKLCLCAVVLIVYMVAFLSPLGAFSSPLQNRSLIAAFWVWAPLSWFTLSITSAVMILIRKTNYAFSVPAKGLLLGASILEIIMDILWIAWAITGFVFVSKLTWDGLIIGACAILDLVCSVVHSILIFQAFEEQGNPRTSAAIPIVFGFLRTG